MQLGHRCSQSLQLHYRWKRLQTEVGYEFTGMIFLSAKEPFPVLFTTPNEGKVWLREPQGELFLVISPWKQALKTCGLLKMLHGTSALLSGARCHLGSWFYSSFLRCSVRPSSGDYKWSQPTRMFLPISFSFSLNLLKRLLICSFNTTDSLFAEKIHESTSKVFFFLNIIAMCCCLHGLATHAVVTKPG